MARIFPINEWAPAVEATLLDDHEATMAGPLDTSSLHSTTTTKKRFRSLSLCFLRHRPRQVSFYLGDVQDQENTKNDMAIEDAPYDQSDAIPRHTRTASESIRGFIRRASLSLKGIVHRRPSLASENTSTQRRKGSARPNTAHGTWNRFRQAAGVRHSRSSHGLKMSLTSTLMFQEQDLTFGFTFPAVGATPPVLPYHGGAAAKASAAMQNELYVRQTLHSKWLEATQEDGDDRESGIGIVVKLGDMNDGAIPQQDASISRVDFIALLPIELAIHILASLDPTALAKACQVSRNWNRVIGNTHIWRESGLRVMTVGFATSGLIEPGTGLGLPPLGPTNDWRQICRVKEQLAQRWRTGKAQPYYLNGHKDSIYCLQFDEHKIVTGSRDRTIRVWDMHTLECRLVIGPAEVVFAKSLLVDNEGQPTHFATSSENRKTAHSMPTAVSYDKHHLASILCLQYDDEILVTGSSDASCIVYDVQSSYRPIRRLQYHTAAVLDLTFDAKHIVTCSKDHTICVWRRDNGSLLRQLKGHDGPVNAVQMRGNTVVSCSGDYRVKLWNIDTGKNIREFVGHTKGLACSQFSEDGRYVASAGNDKMIRIWDANTGECVREMKAHLDLVRSLHIDSASGRLVSASYDRGIKIWDMETGHQLLYFPQWHASWVLSAKSDYRRIVSTGQDPKILIMDFGADVAGIEMLEC